MTLFSRRRSIPTARRTRGRSSRASRASAGSGPTTSISICSTGAGSQPLEETFRALETLRQDGKIRAWGVSNFDVADLEAAIAIVGERVIACNQVLYHLRERDAEHVLQVFCERQRIALVAYSPFGSGDFPVDAPVLVRIARAHRVTPHAVALAWLARHSFVIPKTASAAHVDDLARAGTLRLDRMDIESIDEAFPLGPPRSVIPTI